MEKQELKQRAVSYIEEQKERLIGYGEALYAMPEPGYREYRTSSYVKKVLTDLGLNIQDKIAITGLKAKAEGKEHKANVGLMGELDAVIDPYAAYVVPAKIAVCTVIDLLYDGAKEALKIKENFRPIFDSTEAYKAFRAAHEN